MDIAPTDTNTSTAPTSSTLSTIVTVTATRTATKCIFIVLPQVLPCQDDLHTYMQEQVKGTYIKHACTYNYKDLPSHACMCVRGQHLDFPFDRAIHGPWAFLCGTAAASYARDSERRPQTWMRRRSPSNK